MEKIHLFFTVMFAVVLLALLVGMYVSIREMIELKKQEKKDNDVG